MAIHLGLRFPGGSSGVPGPSAGRVSGTCFALHRTGFGEPPCHHGAGGLLPHRFTLTGACAPAVSSLFHFPSAFAAWGFPSVLPYGVRTFLGRSRPPAATRPAAWIVRRLRAPDVTRAGVSRRCAPAAGRPRAPLGRPPGARGTPGRPGRRGAA